MHYFIDTNIFLRVLTADNKKQYKDSILLLKKIKENKIDAVTGTIVIAEIVWSLGSYYQFSKEKIIRAVRSVINLRGIKIIDDYNDLLAIELYEKYSVKYIDALITTYKIIQEKKCIIVSYDKDFDKLSVLRKEPIDLIK